MRLRRTDLSLGALAAALGLVLAATLAPHAAEACFVCFGGKDSDWPAAFQLGVGLLLVLPPAIVGFAGYTIYRSIKRQEALRHADEASR